MADNSILSSAIKYCDNLSRQCPAMVRVVIPKTYVKGISSMGIQ